jgi:hypothetical protein
MYEFRSGILVNGPVSFINVDPTAPGLRMKASGSGNWVEWRNGSDVLTVWIDSAGKFNGGQMALTGLLTTASITTSDTATVSIGSVSSAGAKLKLPNGTAASPAIQFLGETNTGMHRLLGGSGMAFSILGNDLLTMSVQTGPSLDTSLHITAPSVDVISGGFLSDMYVGAVVPPAPDIAPQIDLVEETGSLSGSIQYAFFFARGDQWGPLGPASDSIDATGSTSITIANTPLLFDDPADHLFLARSINADTWYVFDLGTGGAGLPFTDDGSLEPVGPWAQGAQTVVNRGSITARDLTLVGGIICDTLYGNAATIGTVITGFISGNGSAITNLNPSNINGIVPTDKLGTGTANSSRFLRGDQTWATVPQDATMNGIFNVFGGF